jgi:hypothetical protein
VIGFYDWVYFKENAGMGEIALGRFLGVSHRIGQLMSYWILNLSGKIMSRTTVSRVTNLELQQTEVIKRCKTFDLTIAKYLKDEENLVVLDPQERDFDLDDYNAKEADAEFQEEFGLVLNNESIPEADIREAQVNADEVTPDTFDTYLNMEISLPRGQNDELEYGRVAKRAKDTDGNPIGVANENPILDTRMYEVQWLDGHSGLMFANTIAENLYAQVDDEGNRHVMFHDITAHRKTSEALTDADAYVQMQHGMRRRKYTTKG